MYSYALQFEELTKRIFFKSVCTYYSQKGKLIVKVYSQVQTIYTKAYLGICDSSMARYWYDTVSEENLVANFLFRFRTKVRHFYVNTA